MAITLTVKNVPEDVAARLRKRAARHHRSLQGELLTIVNEAATATPLLSPREVLARARALRVAGGPNSARIVRAARDAR